MAHDHDPGIREVKAGGPERQGHSWIQGEFEEASLGHMRLSQKNKEKVCC